MGLCVVSIASLHAMAAPPSMTTIGQLYREENGGDDPDRIQDVGYPVVAKGIPRDFPLPASSRHLVASTVFPKASVTGTMEIAETFYTEVLPLKGWHIYRRIKVPDKGYGGGFSIVACQVSQCVTLNALSNDHDDADTSDDEDENDRDENDPAAQKKAIALGQDRIKRGNSSVRKGPPTIHFSFYKKEGADPAIFQKRRGEK